MTAEVAPRSLFEKIWERHAIKSLADGYTLLFIDRHLYHEGSFHAFERLRREKLSVAHPELNFGMADHYVPTHGRRLEDISADDIRETVSRFGRNAREFGLRAFEMGDRRQGIVHVVGPEQGITLPGMTVVCGDSHTTTHGALGALAFGVGASEVAHVLATQTLWQARPRTMRITIDGELAAGIVAKDVALAVLARLGANGANGYIVEFAGSTVQSMSVEGRLTLCNMSVEAGARAGLVAPDMTTLAYIAGRPFAPKADMLEQATKNWLALTSDEGAAFDREIGISVAEIGPMVTWGTSPDSVVSVTGRVPDPDRVTDAAQRPMMQRELDYMGLTPNTLIADIRIDRVFIGSCTNGRIEDLRAAAQVAKLGRAIIPALVSPGSTQVKTHAESEGLDRIFIDAGFLWGESGCSMCVGINGDVVAPGERCASTTNRNFRGRQGTGSRTHLVSPAMAAAAALTGRLVDPRPLLANGGRT